MKYRFPVIKHADEVRAAIAGKDEFIEVDKGDHVIFNYLVNFENTFPPVWEKWIAPLDGEIMIMNREAAILRECRGFIFDKNTGKPVARRYHKFFNKGEKEETRDENIDWTQPHILLEKLDGSFITPYFINGKMKIGTKMGETNVAENARKFVEANKNYQEFINFWQTSGTTLIFEWCSWKNQIVVFYPDDRLVLTGMRNTTTGEYIPYEAMIDYASEYKIDYVKEVPISKLDELEYLKDEEGYIIRFDDGHMVKVKCSWYLQLHRMLDSVKQEKDVIQLILDDRLDDAKSLFPEKLAKKLDEFGSAITRNIKEYSDNLASETAKQILKAEGNRKDFALAVKDLSESGIRFKYFQELILNPKKYVGNIYATEEFFLAKVRELVYNSCNTSTKVEGIRHIIKEVWTNND